MLAHQRSAQLFCFDLTFQKMLTISTEALWVYHEAGLQAYRKHQSTFGGDNKSGRQLPGVSWLVLKRELAFRQLTQCDFCVHDCRVNRRLGVQGYCQLSADSPFSGAYLH